MVFYDSPSFVNRTAVVKIEQPLSSGRARFKTMGFHSWSFILISVSHRVQRKYPYSWNSTILALYFLFVFETNCNTISYVPRRKQNFSLSQSHTIWTTYMRKRHIEIHPQVIETHEQRMILFGVVRVHCWWLWWKKYSPYRGNVEGNGWIWCRKRQII